MTDYTPKDIDRFWRKVDKSNGDDSCWNWTAYVHWKGYGQFSVRGKKRTLRTHRFVYEITFGAIPDHLQVCHSCDNRKCCNPKHLFLGTSLDNTSDMVSKGRHSHGTRHSAVTRHGEQHGGHKLTDQKVKYIREKYKTGTISQRELAHEMGVSKTLIGNIIREKAWKCVS